MASKTYKAFTEDLESSRKAVMAVAQHIQSSGRDVILPIHSVTPNEESRYSYQDQCDLKVAIPHQIKQSSREFKSVDEFGFQMITVDEKYKIEKQKQSPPFAYWIVNKSRSGAIVIPWSSKKHWDTLKSKDPLQNERLCEFARCPASLCNYISFIK